MPIVAFMQRSAKILNFKIRRDHQNFFLEPILDYVPKNDKKNYFFFVVCRS